MVIRLKLVFFLLKKLVKDPNLINLATSSIVGLPVKSEGNYTYTNASECEGNPLAETLFSLSPAIREVYFFDNYITVTQDGSADWDSLERNIRAAIIKKAADHDPDFKTPETKKSTSVTQESSPDLDKINAILDQTVRPALQMDGGDVQAVSYQDKQLQVLYQGACGSCPSATMGTLNAIQSILQDQFDPEITVALADPF